MVKCPSCGKEVGDAAFCNNCGSKLHSQKKNEKIKSNDFQEKKFCANCGSEMNVNATFCSNCGTHELKATNQVGNNLVATFNPGTAFFNIYIHYRCGTYLFGII